MAEYAGWEKVRQIGGGGQSTVFLVLCPERKQQIADAERNMLEAIKSGRMADLAKSVEEFNRGPQPRELGALKVFDKRRSEATEERIRQEILILERGRYPNLPKLLASNAKERWMITEYFPDGSLENSIDRFMGKPLEALEALVPLLSTLAMLHQNTIHRDIKPANIFLDEGRLILGDFGIAFQPNGGERVTATHERVGPWDYMPQWADTGARLNDVRPSFDLYMVGKLLWCMISGRLRLPREYFRRDEFNLEKLFLHDPRMKTINEILDACVVEYESECIQAATDLLLLVQKAIAEMRGPSINGHPRLHVDKKGDIILQCMVCAKANYREELNGNAVWLSTSDTQGRLNPALSVMVYCCDVCGHRIFFSPHKPFSPQPIAIDIKDRKAIDTYTELYERLGEVRWKLTDLNAIDRTQEARDAVYDILTLLNKAQIIGGNSTYAAILPDIKINTEVLKAYSHGIGVIITDTKLADDLRTLLTQLLAIPIEM